MSDDLPRNYSNAVPRYYSNAVGVSATLHDIMVTFAQVTVVTFPDEPGDVPKQAREPQCQVILSYPHAKALLPILSGIIASYETEFGQVPAPGINTDI